MTAMAGSTARMEGASATRHVGRFVTTASTTTQTAASTARTSLASVPRFAAKTVRTDWTTTETVSSTAVTPAAARIRPVFERARAELRFHSIALLALITASISACAGRTYITDISVFAGEGGTIHFAATFSESDEGGGAPIGFTYLQIGDEGVLGSSSGRSRDTEIRIVADDVNTPYVMYGGTDRGILTFTRGAWSPITGLDTLSDALRRNISAGHKVHFWRQNDGVVRLLYELPDNLTVLEIASGAARREIPIAPPAGSIRQLAATSFGSSLHMAFETSDTIQIAELKCEPDCAWTQVGTLLLPTRRIRLDGALVITEGGSPFMVTGTQVEGEESWRVVVLSATGEFLLPYHSGRAVALPLPEGGFATAFVPFEGAGLPRENHLLFFDEEGVLQVDHMLDGGFGDPEIVVQTNRDGHGQIRFFQQISSNDRFSILERRVDASGVLDERTFEVPMP